MKSLLLPLLAALALPTAVNAEIFYLQCKSNGSNPTEFTVIINEGNSIAQIDYNNSKI